jgi:hypothetical protein
VTEDAVSAATKTLPVMSDPDIQIMAGECYAGWDIAEWFRWSVCTTDCIEDDPTLFVVASGRNESHLRTVTTAQLRLLAGHLTQLADHVDAEAK